MIESNLNSKFKFIGGVFLIVGTSIGGGMLGIPVANASIGVAPASALLFICWSLMTLSALLILEVNMWLPQGSNLLTMAEQTLGKVGRYLAWFCFLLLFYSLLCAYVAGGADVFHSMLQLAKIPFIKPWMSIVLFALIFGALVHGGIRVVVKMTNGLMILKTILFAFLIAILLPEMSTANFASERTLHFASALMVMITSFGFSIIVPSLRIYFDNDVMKLRLAIIAGSLVILFVYLLWNMVVSGVIPRLGDPSLHALHESNSQNSDILLALRSLTDSSLITYSFQSFAAVVLLTSFIGVALAMTDFLADGFTVEKQGVKGLSITFLTFVPPTLIVLFHPGIFAAALTYAGIIVVVLLIALPALMAWSGRYVQNIANTDDYRVIGGKLTLGVILLMSLILLAIAGTLTFMS